MTDIPEATSQAVVERLKSPFVGTFVLVWGLSNWKFFAFLFMGDDPIDKRIVSAESTLNVMLSLYVPLGAAFLYTSIWPWINYLIERYHSAIKFRGTIASVRENHEIELQKLKNKLSSLRYETNEHHAIEKLLKTQASFKSLLEQQKEFIAEADQVLQVAEERASKIANFQSMLMMFREHHEEYLERAAEKETQADARKVRGTSTKSNDGAA